MVLPGVLVGFACGVGRPVLPHRLPWGIGGRGALLSVSASVQVPQSLRSSFLWLLGCHL